MQVQSEVFNLKSNFQMESQQFTVGDPKLIMEALSKLYSNPIQTLTQEYLCNARDANRESKSKTPIHIIAPSVLNPIMTIRDYGIGLSEERIRKVFLNYGVSTKSKTNDYTGGFGIGAKSAWAYTDSFTIISYVDGLKTTYLAHKTTEGASLSVLSKEIKPVSEPNGVAIQITVKEKDVESFKEAIKRTIFFWEKKEKPTFSNLNPTFFFENNCFSLDDFYFRKKDDYTREAIFVIDGIPYKVNKFQLSEKLKNLQVIKFFNNGEFKIAPSREELIYDDNTKTKVVAIEEALRTSVNNFIYSKFKTCEKLITQQNFKLAIETYLSLGEIISSDWAEKLEINEYLDCKFHNFYFTDDSNKEQALLKTKKYKHMSVSIANGVFYYKDDLLAKESNAKLSYRIKKLDDNSYLLNPKHRGFKKFIKCLDAIPLSSIDISDYRPAKSTRTRLQDQDVTIHVVREHTSIKGATYIDKIKLATNITTFIYLDKDFASEYKQQLIDFAQFVKQFPNSQACLISKSNQVVIKNDPKFIKYADFLNNFVIENSHIERFFYETLPNTNLFSLIQKNFKDLKPKLQKKLVVYNFKLGKNNFYFAPELIEKIKATKYFKELTDTLEVMNDIQSQCSMLKFVSEYNMNSDPKTILSYINTTWKG